jgi:hypothetical protein
MLDRTALCWAEQSRAGIRGCSPRSHFHVVFIRDENVLENLLAQAQLKLVSTVALDVGETLSI